MAYIDGKEVLFSPVVISDSTKWKLLMETEITQEMIDEAGEEGITALVLEFDPIKEWYGETWIRVECGATTDLNSNDDGIWCGIGKDIKAASGGYDREGIFIMKGVSGSVVALNRQYNNYISLFTNWYDNKARGTIAYRNGHSSRSYPLQAYATSNFDNEEIIGCKYLYFGSMNKGFKFPVGTTLKLYGRF